MSGFPRDGMAVRHKFWTQIPMSTQTNPPTLRTRGLGSIASSCAALAVSVFFAGGMWLVMR